MKNCKIILVSLLLFTSVAQVNGQSSFFETLRTSSWIFGAGWNIVDDNGSPGRIFTVGEAWNMKSYPASIRVEKEYQNGFWFVFKGTYNQYNGAKTINSEPGITSTFLAFDLGARYNFCKLYDINTEWFNFSNEVFDTYGALELGFTLRNTDKVGPSPTLNVGFGMHAWVYKGWGINLEAMGKFGLTGKLIATPANYTQYSFGVVYKLGSNKRLQPKGDKFKKFNTRKARTKIG